MQLPSITSNDVSGKKVVLRGDLDVPLTKSMGAGEEYVVEDDSRLEAMMPTVKYLMEKNCQITIIGHLGKPGGKVMTELSVKPVANWFCKRLGEQSIQEEAVGSLQGFRVGKNVVIGENLRFLPGEESNDENLAKELASLGDLYVNESFGECHKTVASIVGVAKILPHFAGERLIKEVEMLSGVLESPKRPMVVIMGGAKIETKMGVISKMADLADMVIIGGKLLREINPDEMAGKLSDEGNLKVYLLGLTEAEKDITLSSIDNVSHLIDEAGTIIWNGPLGMVEDYTYQVGTRRLAELVVHNDRAFKLVGGGDTVGFLKKLGLIDKFNWVSVGGGAMLKFLSGEELPGLVALVN